MQNCGLRMRCEYRCSALNWIPHKMTPESFENVFKRIQSYLNIFSLESRSYLNIFSNKSRFVSNYLQIHPLFANDSPTVKLFFFFFWSLQTMIKSVCMHKLPECILALTPVKVQLDSSEYILNLLLECNECMFIWLYDVHKWFCSLKDFFWRFSLIFYLFTDTLFRDISTRIRNIYFHWLASYIWTITWALLYQR